MLEFLHCQVQSFRSDGQLQKRSSTHSSVLNLMCGRTEFSSLNFSYMARLRTRVRTFTRRFHALLGLLRGDRQAMHEKPDSAVRWIIDLYIK